jgi:hypothetical protein
MCEHELGTTGESVGKTEKQAFAGEFHFAHDSFRLTHFLKVLGLVRCERR